jgi:hypothetical protein
MNAIAHQGANVANIELQHGQRTVPADHVHGVKIIEHRGVLTAFFDA